MRSMYLSDIYAVKTHHPFHVKARCEVPRRYPGVPGVPGVPSVYKSEPPIDV